MTGKRTRRAWFGGVALVAALTSLVMLSSCQSVVERRDPTGEVFPRVTGESLSGERRTFPDDFLGAPTLVLIGFRQNSQFDIDRWLLAADQAGLEVRVVEVPTIPGLGARMASGYIDGGMRSGIPSEDWASVVCLYADASQVVRFTGNENPNPTRVVLLDGDGKVAFFHDRGFSVGSLRRLQESLREVSPR